MRYIIFISLLIFALGCAGPKNTAREQHQLNGTWVPVKQEISGKMLPYAVFEKQQLVIFDSTYTFTAESVDKGIVKYTADKMDIYGKDGVNKGKHFTALYKVENDHLTICYNLMGDGYPETFETKTKPMYFLSVFKKLIQ